MFRDSVVRIYTNLEVVPYIFYDAVGGEFIPTWEFHAELLNLTGCKVSIYSFRRKALKHKKTTGNTRKN